MNKKKLSSDLAEAQSIHNDLLPLNEPFAKHTKLKLNYGPKYTPFDIQGNITYFNHVQAE